MRMYDIILKKRNGLALTREEIHFFVTNYVNEVIPDYQASALMMAIYFRGMTDEETVMLTEEMANSGYSLNLSDFGELTVDKHSTGGVGDKTTIIVAPILASLGAKVAKMSGRGLGHTGGTVDKLESIAGYKTTLSKTEFLSQVQDYGIAVIGQTENIAPADKKIYALRDVTATVDNVSLIASSIMSKKIAAGAKSIVLDVKVGSGAFMKTLDDARHLAKTMVSIGKGCGRRMCAVLTNMNVPLGMCIGNSLEIEEAISVLKGEGEKNLTLVCTTLAEKMAQLSLGYSENEAKEAVSDALRSGKALAKFYEWIIAQGASAECIKKNDFLPKANAAFNIIARQDGYISRMDTEKIGICASLTGAGRENKNDTIDLSAGIRLYYKTGDHVKKGDILATVYTSKQGTEQNINDLYFEAVDFSCTPPDTEALILDIIE